MGAGGQTTTLNLKGKSEVSWTVNPNPIARNLRKNELGAVIFGCKHHTFKECLLKQIFGLPAQHISYVKNVTPGLPLFLFNYSDRTLHGIFEAKTAGQMNINPYAWITSDGMETTLYPAQVRIDVRRQCHPLLENEFKPILSKNYYEDRFFWFELDKEQTSGLIKLFGSASLPEKISILPNVAKWNNMFDVFSEGEDEAAEHQHEDVKHSYAAVVNGNTSTSQKNWAELFKNPSSNLTKNGKILESQNLKLNKSTPDGPSSNFTKNGKILESWNLKLNKSKPVGPSSENRTFGKILESWNLKLNKSKPVGPSSENRTFESMVVNAPGEKVNNMCGEVLRDKEYSEFKSVVAKLLQEVEGLKISELKRRQKVDSLEHDLVQSKLEIDQLKKKCNELESMASSTSDQCDAQNSEVSTISAEESVLDDVGELDGQSWFQDMTSYSSSKDSILSLCRMTLPRSYASRLKI